VNVERLLRLIAGAFVLRSLWGIGSARIGFCSPPCRVQPFPIRFHKLVPDDDRPAQSKSERLVAETAFRDSQATESWR
jgi:hypothetical protein